MLLALPARAGVITFDSSGDVVLAPTKAPGVWYTDRYNPAGFASGQAGGGRLGVLKHSISDADSSSKRPSGYTGAFYNTQGRNFDLLSGASTLAIDLYVPASWDSLNQSESGSGRLASLWATGVDGADNVTHYPIIEFNNNRDGLSDNGFRIWDSDTSTWTNVLGFAGYDQWYRIGFSLIGNQFEYTVNNVNVHTDSAVGGTTSFRNVILQGYNGGNSYDIYWDNLASNGIAGAEIPEPTSLVVFGVAGLAGAVYYRRRKATTGSAHVG